MSLLVPGGGHGSTVQAGAVKSGPPRADATGVLPGFIIGLREGLETVLVLGAIALFLVHEGRRAQLRVLWGASAAAVGLCVVVSIGLPLLEVGLSTLATDRLDAVVDLAAVATVTYMVIWMRRFPKDLARDTAALATRRLRDGSARALALLAFAVVVREGFEVSIFVLAVTGDHAGTRLVGAVGAAAGVLVAVGFGWAVARSRIVVDVPRFFRITGALLVLSAAGLAMGAVSSANAGGWLVFAQAPRFDWSALSPSGSLRSSVFSGLLGLQPYPTLLDVSVWAAYLVPMLLVVVIPRGLPTRMMGALPPRTRRLAVVSGLCTALCLVLSGPVLRAALGTAAADTDSGPAQMSLPSGGLEGGGYLLFRDTTLGPDYGRLGLVGAQDPSGPRALTSMSCDRVDFEGGLGLCLERPDSGLAPATTATVFDDRFRPLRTVTLTGFPSRARVSPDGRYGAVTTFVTGDSYAAIDAYSTRTDIINMRTGTVVFDLSQLIVHKAGKVFSAPNFNFWGVTFSPDGRNFYATLGTGPTTYLIKGDLRTRSATVITSNVECPSLSPDGREIAFKRRLPGSTVRWRLSVLDLATGRVHPLAETRSVDDQVEWLDNTTVLYGVLADATIAAMDPLSVTTPSLTDGAELVTNTWSVPADGTGRPRLVSSDTWSEVVTDR